MIKRIISCVLVLLITLSSFPLFSFANEKNETSKLLVRQNQYKVIDVIKSGDEILMKTEDLAFLSAFVLKDEGHNAYFTRGAKTVFVDKERNTVSIEGRSYGLSLNPGCKNIDGIWYLPASQILPWLNVQVGVENGVLTSLPNPFSLWDELYNFDLEDYYFNLGEICSTIGISSFRLESSAFVKNNGLGGLTYLVTDTKSSSMGEENAYYELFSDMVKDVSATDTEIDKWFEHYETFCDTLDMAKGALEAFDNDISKAFDTGNSLTITKNALDLLVYTVLFSEDGESKTDFLKTLIGGSESNSNSGMISAAADVIDEYSNYWDGIYSKIKHHIISGVQDTINSATVLGLLHLANKMTEGWAEAIDRINLRENIMAEALDGYECYTTELDTKSLNNLVNFIMLYLYSYEMNYRAIAIYMESKFRGPQWAHDEYVKKANEAEKLLGKFINVKVMLEDDAESFDFKREKAEKIKETFKEINFRTVPSGVTAVSEIAIYLEIMKDMNLLNLKYNVTDFDGDGDMELISQFDAMMVEDYPSFFVLDPNAMASSSYTSPTFSEYPELKVTNDSKNYYIHSNIDGDYIGEDFYTLENGIWSSVLGYYAFYDYLPSIEDYGITDEKYYKAYGTEIKKDEYEKESSALSDSLKDPEFSNPDYSNIIIKCNTDKALSDLRSFYKWRGQCCFKYHYDINGDGTKDSLYVLYNAADFWQDKCYEVKSFGGENHIYYEDNKITVLVAESTEGGIQLRTCRLDAFNIKNELLGDSLLFEFDIEEGVLRLGDHIYTYNPKGKPFTDEKINYAIDLMGKSPEEVENTVENYFEFGEYDKGIASGDLNGCMLTLIFSENYGIKRENSVLYEMRLTPVSDEKCYLIRGVDTSMTMKEMLKNAENCKTFSDLAPSYDEDGNLSGYETYTVYTHTDNCIYGVTAVFESRSVNSKLSYMKIVKLGEIGHLPE